MSNDLEVGRVVSAWRNAGPHPWYHNLQVQEVRRRMPLLADALDSLADAYERERPKYFLQCECCPL